MLPIRKEIVALAASSARWLLLKICSLRNRRIAKIVSVLDLQQPLMTLYRTIGRAVQLSENTVRKYVAGLEEKGLIRTEPSTITTKDGRVRNGSLIYTIRPIQEALELNYQRQFLRAERDMERAKAEKRLAELNRQNEKKEEESA